MGEGSTSDGRGTTEGGTNTTGSPSPCLIKGFSVNSQGFSVNGKKGFCSLPPLKMFYLGKSPGRALAEAPAMGGAP